MLPLLSLLQVRSSCTLVELSSGKSTHLKLFLWLLIKSVFDIRLSQASFESMFIPGEFQRENIRRVVDMVQTALFMPPYHFSARDAGLPNALGKTRFENCVDQAHLPLHIFIASSSSVGMQLTQVLTPSQCKERFLSVHRRRQEQVGRVFFFSLRLLLL